ncbi:MAG: acetyl-CoA hydrolase/transferase family protein [Myxococcales bacterium]|nr:acetyl-CoA hydrolase/transferase family protein [Myxococcales bacterium]
MIDWKPRYEAKRCTAADAIKRIRPRQRILIGSGVGEPEHLVQALCQEGGHLYDNEIVHLLTLGSAPYVAPEFAGRFRHLAFFIGANVREAVNTCRADFMPVFLGEIPRLIRTQLPIDVALIQVSPPDEHGFMTLGVSVDIVRSAVDTADMVIAEVNPNMPRTWGDTTVHVDDVGCIIEVDYKLPSLPIPELGDVERSIGRHVASLIPDGATLQMGIGRIPDAVLKELGNHHDLGIHTEMFSDGVIDLVDGGVINGRAKTYKTGKIVTSFVMGSQRLYDWIHDHPSVEFRPSDYTNDPFLIARHDRMVAINSAIAVDLTGQVQSDTIGGMFYSGIGGQVDFIRGAARSKGGRPIIAIPATAKRGTVSRIQPTLEQGSGVVTSRGDVQYVVTEFGVAKLWGKSVRQRTEALIAVAHPDFREELRAQAAQRRYILT